MTIKRRDLVKGIALTAGLSMFPKVSLAALRSTPSQRVVIIGGGFSGATAAKYLKMWSPDLEVVLIEKNAQFISCPQSNLILSGARTLDQLTFSYDDLTNHHGVKRVQATVVDIHPEKQKLRLHDDVEISYDRLIIAPGVDFDYSMFPSLTPEVVSKQIPHAWKAGKQTILLRDQLKSMRSGGRVVMTIPPMPFRCPPGPYERACQIADFLKKYNPKAKLIIFDASNDIVIKKDLFKGAWDNDYAGLIEYNPSNALTGVNVKTQQVETLFDTVKADVINVIPPQRAGKVSELAGVVNDDNRWCRVDFLSYESTSIPKVHVIGDALSAGLPKSGHMANAQAKVCAAAVIALLKEQELESEPVFGNTCYSFVSETQAGHIAELFRYDKATSQMVVQLPKNISKVGTRQEAKYADAWATNIWSDTLG